NFLIVGQVAASLMLLLITGFLVMGLSQARRIETKFDGNRMYLLSVDPVRDGYTAEKAAAFFEKLPERLKSAGGVKSIALTAQERFLLHDDDDGGLQVSAEEAPGATRVQKQVAEERVGAGYFATLNEAMVSGLEFEERDQRSVAEGTTGALPAVLNETAERG